MAGSACFHSTLPWSFLPFRVWTGLVLTRIESKKATAQPQSPAPLQPACQGRQAQAGPFWLSGHRAALLESSPSGFNCFYILIIILFAKVWNEDMKKSNRFRTPQPFKTLPWSLQSMGGFSLSVCIWVKLQAIKLGKAVPSGSITTCLHQDLADTCSHQSYLRIVHSPFSFCNLYTPTHELPSHESACMPDLYVPLACGVGIADPDALLLPGLCAEFLIKALSWLLPP